MEEGREGSAENIVSAEEVELQRILGKYISEDLKQKEGVRVLSVGAGEGLDARPVRNLLTKMNPEDYLALDGNEGLVELAKESHEEMPEQSFQVGDFVRHNPDYGNRDIVLMRVVEAGPNFAEGRLLQDIRDREFFNNAREVLNANGVMVVTAGDINSLERITSFLSRSDEQHQYVPIVGPENIEKPLDPRNYPGKVESVAVTIRKSLRQSAVR